MKYNKSSKEHLLEKAVMLHYSPLNGEVILWRRVLLQAIADLKCKGSPYNASLIIDESIKFFDRNDDVKLYSDLAQIPYDYVIQVKDWFLKDEK